jgi:flavorubredoxin
MITNTQSGTNVHEVADGIFRINTPVDLGATGRFNFNQYLIVDDQPLLFHTGPRKLFPLVQEAVASVIAVETLRFVGLSHFEADECGSLNAFLAVAPRAEAVCGNVAAVVSVTDYADRPPRALADNERLSLGRHQLRWLDTPHVPHAWDCGLLMEMSTGTLLCGDLFTQGGPGDIALTESDILGPSDAFRQPMDYFAHAPQTRETLERLACLQPNTLACMHGSAWQGDCAGLLRALSATLANASGAR